MHALSLSLSQTLRSIPFFQYINENKPWSKIGILGGLFRFEEYAPGHVVFREGVRMCYVLCVCCY